MMRNRPYDRKRRQRGKDPEYPIGYKEQEEWMRGRSGEDWDRFSDRDCDCDDREERDCDDRRPNRDRDHCHDRDCDCDCDCDRDNCDHFFFRSNGAAIWADRQWSSGSKKRCCRCRCICKCPTGAIGTTGVTGRTGATGATGATGPTGECKCPCQPSGELILNGGMESFTGGIPTFWSSTSPTGTVSPVTAQGRVHSGASAVNLTNGANLSQTVPINEGCFYELSFFARGEGSQVGVSATVTFITPPSTQTVGLQITVRQQDMTNSNRDFGFYQGITIAAPVGATSAQIKFVVTANGGQSMDLDDVSFALQ